MVTKPPRESSSREGDRAERDDRDGGRQPLVEQAARLAQVQDRPVDDRRGGGGDDEPVDRDEHEPVGPAGDGVGAADRPERGENGHREVVTSTLERVAKSIPIHSRRVGSPTPCQLRRAAGRVFERAEDAMARAGPGRVELDRMTRGAIARAGPNGNRSMGTET